jgi:hypothetical protein
MRSRRRIAGCLAAFLVLPALPASAHGAPAFRDRVLTGPVARSSQLKASAAKAFRTPDGAAIDVQISTDVPNPDAVAQEIVNFLGTRVHGQELSRLRVFIGVPAEISDACGGGSEVLACYSASERRMYIPDRDPSAGRAGAFTRDYAVTHEYGHHVAAFRSNSPFPALNYGAKYWSSYEFVCSGALSGAYFPGDQGEHYLDDPGEAFADAYAHLPENGFSGVPWQFNGGLRPDVGAFAALRRDVLDPWRASRRKVVTGSLGAVRRSRLTAVRLGLDGSLDLKLHGPRGANFDLAIYDGSRLISRTRTAGAQDHLRTTLCRDGSPTETLRVRVSRRSGAGAYSLTAVYPG